tara:strand:- start:6618 stop:7154 length:537 start_codon:yes stop_codon:yes gene_type:complete
MRIINLVNFRKDSNGIDIGSNNDFTCYFNRAITIQPNSKVILLHAEINNTTGATATNDNQVSANDAVSADMAGSTTKPKELVFINIPTLPIVSYTGTSNGGKGRENHIIGAAKTNVDDSVFSTGFEVDLHNTHPLLITALQVQILDTDYDLKVFGGGGPFRQLVTIGIKECKCDMKKK